MRSKRIAGILLYCAGVALLSFSAAILTSGPFWARAWLAFPVWIGVLLFIDGLNAALQDRSPFLDSPARFVGVAALSIPWWLLHELANLRLALWAPPAPAGGPVLRWIGYAFASAVVLPVLVELKELLAGVFPLQRLSTRSFRLTEGMRDTMVLGGLAFLVLPLGWPEIFHPLLWIAAFLLIEPGLSRAAPLGSALFELSLGNVESLLAWLGAGGLLALLAWAGEQVGVLEAMGMPPGAAPFFALSSASVIGLALYLWPRVDVWLRATSVFLASALTAVLFRILERAAGL